MDELTKVFFEHGLLGVVTVLSMLVSIRLYRELAVARAAHLKAVEQATEIHRKSVEDHKRVLDEWQARYIAKAESWMEKYQGLAGSINEVLEALTEKYDRENGETERRDERNKR